MADEIVLPLPDDFHAHLRRGPSLAAYAQRHAASFGRALVMPNTEPPIASGAEIERYRDEIVSAAELAPLMAFKLLPGMTATAVAACASAGALAGKYYPAGSTTNAEDGISDQAQVEEALAAMEDLGLVLSIHGEEPSAPVLEREAAFLPRVADILARHGRLRVVLEHLSSREALAFVLARAAGHGAAEGSAVPSGRLAATVTAHHLLFSIDDLLGGKLDPHLFCKPPLKSRVDRDALRGAVFSGAPCVFFGSDSAPHPRSAKEGRTAAAGIYSSPSALPALASLFEEEGCLDFLAPFVAARGAAFYGLPAPRGSLVLRREAWTVPEELDGAVPMLAGKRLRWRIAASTRPANGA